MNIDEKSLHDVRKIPGEKLGVRTISNVEVLSEGNVELTFSDKTKKELPAPMPKPLRNIISATIINNDLIINFDNDTSESVGRVNPLYTKKPPNITGSGLLVDSNTGKFKKLAAKGLRLTVTETPSEYKLTLNLSGLPTPPPKPTGALDYSQAMSSTWKSTTKVSLSTVGAVFYIPGSDNTAWNNYDVSGLNYPSPYQITFNPDRSFTLPAGHYYLDFHTQLATSGVAELQLWDITNNKVVMSAVGHETITSADYSVHQGVSMCGEFVLTAPTTLWLRGKASSKFSYYGYTLDRPGIAHHIACTLLLWKISDTDLNLNRNTPQLNNSWKQLTAVYNPTSAPSTATGTFSVPYTCGATNLYVNTVKAISGANYIIPDSARAFVYLSDDGLVKMELPSPVNISTGTRPFGKHSTLANDGTIYVPAYNATQHVRIVPMPVGGWIRPQVGSGYDYFARPIALHDPHVTITAPTAVAGHSSILTTLQNSKGIGQANEYFSVASATPEVSIKLRQPVTLKELVFSCGTFGAVTAAKLYSVTGGVRTLLGSCIYDGVKLVCPTLTGAAAAEYVIVIETASGAPGAIQFGCNGIRLIVAEEKDTAKFEGVVELIPGAVNSTVTAKYEIAQSSPATDEIMFIPVSNFETRKGFEFFNPVTKTWRNNTFGLVIDPGHIFSCAICSPLNNHIFIFTRNTGANFYVYDPAKKAIKALPYMPIGVDCVVNGLDGRIYGAIGNSNSLTVVDPLTHYTWNLGIDATYTPTAEIMQMLFGNDGKLRLFPNDGYVFHVDFANMTCTKDLQTTWWYINVRMLNGEYFAFIARRLSGADAVISNYYYKRFTGSFSPDPKLQLGPYVN